MNFNLDYTTLFSSLSSSGSSSGGSGFPTNILADYASIRNGSYGKLLKSYYSKNEFDKSKVLNQNTNTENSKKLTKEFAAIKSDAAQMQESADALTATGSKSLFKTDDRDKIYKAVKSFTEDYNSLLDSSSETDSTSILRSAKNMTSMTSKYAGLLSDIGIEVGSDNKLKLDENTFKGADFSTVKSLFNGTGSYAYNVSSRASMIGYATGSEINKGSLYTGFGGYNTSGSSGSFFDNYL